MPLINTTYTKTASFTPAKATGVAYFWAIDGTILSGQGTNSIEVYINSNVISTFAIDIIGTDCDGTNSNYTMGISIQPSCIPITSCSF
jgi:hypothetical protein